MARKRIKTDFKRSYTYGEYLTLYRYCTEEIRSELDAIMKEAKRPDELCGKKVPKDLGEVSYGMLDDLAIISNGKNNDPVVESIARVLEIDNKSLVYDQNVFDVFGMMLFIGREVTRINEAFEKIKPKYTEEEKMAGVLNLNFGSFGVLDWYSHRQGISDQNAVQHVAWARIYTCIKNDNLKADYEKKLNEVYQQKMKAKNARL